MKKFKGKQTPIFSKLQDILEEKSAGKLSGEPLKNVDAPSRHETQPEEMPLADPIVSPSWNSPSGPTDRDIEKVEIPEPPFLEEGSSASLPNEPFKLASTASLYQSESGNRALPDQAGASSLEPPSSQPDDQNVGEVKISAATILEIVPPKLVLPKREREVVVNSLGMAFVQIQAGTFIMGSPDYEGGRNEDELPHEVSISTNFYLQTTPVTQGQWQAIMGQDADGSVQTGADLPAGGKNWQDCHTFIKKLHTLGEGDYRLPTEAEWEYACRAGSDLALANGELFSLYCEADPTLEKVGWYCGNSDRKLHPVGQKDPNAWGLYDMHGNIGEWCQDWYGPYRENPQADPIGPLSGPGRVIRGGSWFSSAKNCRSAARFHWPPQSRDQLEVLGLRLVKIVSSPVSNTE